MDLSIIIVSWNVEKLLRDCLESIFSKHMSLDIQVIVVDSASSDGTVDMVRTHFPQVALFAMDENIGYTRGNNVGLENASGRHILLLNPDTVVIDDALEAMIDYLDTHPDVGIVGPRTLNADNSVQSTRRRFPTRMTALFESTWLQPYAPKKLLRDYYLDEVADDQTSEVDWVQGSALMARREVYEQIGGLDTGYVMYFEETDWCKRAKAAGWKVVYLGSASIYHLSGASAEQAGSHKHIHFQQSKLRYAYKHLGKWFALVLRLYLLAQYAVQVAIESIKFTLGHKREMRQQRIHTYQDVLRTGLKVNKCESAS